jgi:hypothetical protein
MIKLQSIIFLIQACMATQMVFAAFVSASVSTSDSTDCLPSSDYSAVISDNRKFHRCINGLLFEFECARGTVYDDRIKSCVNEKI